MSKLDEILEKWNMSNVPDLKLELIDLFNDLVDDEVTGTLTHEQLHKRINEL